MKLVDRIAVGEGSLVDDSAIIGYPPSRKVEDKSLSIGLGAKIRSGTVIYGGSTIGDWLETGHGAVIREENKIGDHFCLWNNSTVDYNCTIGSHVKIHSNVYVAQFTVIEDDVFIAPGVTITNDPHPLCSRCMQGPTIKKGARIGAGAIILPRVIIGERALIAAGAVVTKDVPPESVVVGNPGRVVKSINELECKTGERERPYPE